MEVCADGAAGVTGSCTDLAEAFGKCYMFSTEENMKRREKKIVVA